MIYSDILKKKAEGKKQLAVLIDPDKVSVNDLMPLAEAAKECLVDYFFVGGSLIVSDQFETVIGLIKQYSDIPVIIFPGGNHQICVKADGILLLSLISGRNPEYLISQHVIAAPALRRSKLEILSTGYILVDGDNATSVSYMSNTTPIPHDKPEIAACTAIAGEMIGHKLIYLDAGSGAKHHISGKFVKKVKSEINIPLIVGGGIKNCEQAKELYNAGADLIVVGTAVENNYACIYDIAFAVKTIQDERYSDFK